MPARAGTLHGCCMTSARRCPAKSLIAAGPAAACPRTTPPADGVERPGKASTIIFDRASFPRRGAGPLGATRAIGAAASPGPPSAGCTGMGRTAGAQVRNRIACWTTSSTGRVPCPPGRRSLHGIHPGRRDRTPATVRRHHAHRGPGRSDSSGANGMPKARR